MTTTAADHGAVPVGARSTSVVRVRDGLFVYAFAVLYGAIYFAAASAMYLYYLAPRYDLGNMVQVVWATAHGHVLRMSDASGADISPNSQTEWERMKIPSLRYFKRSAARWPSV